MRISYLLASVAIVVSFHEASDRCFAFEPESMLPLKPTRTTRFIAREGTWMSVDVSPDGLRIVFDLLGDLYTLPIEGGRAKRLTSGMAFDSQPRYSPDGRWIVFTSDRSGVNDIWLISTENGELRRLTQSKADAYYISPTWTPDSSAIVVSKQPASKAYIATLVQITIAKGVETEIPISTNSDASAPLPKERLGPVVSSDGRYLYAAENISQPREAYGYWSLVRIDRNTGILTRETSARLGGTGMRPQVSPDNHYLVYGRSNGSYVGMMLRDLRTDEEKWLVPKAMRPLSWWYAGWQRDLLPGSAFTADSKSFITSDGGLLWRIDLETGHKREIPFEADVEQQLGPPVWKEFTLDDKSVKVRLVSDPALSPDGKHVAFSALDKIWVMDLPAGIPRRLTHSHFGEFHPSWSPNGRTIAYATWSDETGGAVYQNAADGLGEPHPLTTDHAHYAGVTYAPDGSRIATIRGSKDLIYLNYSGNPVSKTLIPAREPVLLSVDGNAPVLLGQSDTGAVPGVGDRDGSLQFARDGSLCVYSYAKGLSAVSSSGRRQILKVTSSLGLNGSIHNAKDVVLSPDGRHALAEFASHEVFLLSFDSDIHEGLEVSTNAPPADVQVEEISNFGGDYIGWDLRGDTGIIGLGASLFLFHPHNFNQRIDDKTAMSRVDISLTFPADRPSDAAVKVLRGAQVVTMRGNEVIANSDILIRGNRIAAVGRAGTVPIPLGAEVFNLRGKTVLPGFLDIHCHAFSPVGIHPSNEWKLQTWLSYGVTTIRDPSIWPPAAPDFLTYADRIAIGEMIGPRIFMTLQPINDDERRLKTLEDLQAYVRPYADFYHTEDLKNYMVQGRRRQQLLAIVAREDGLQVTNEGHTDAVQELTEVLDGFMGHEHNSPTIPLYDDVLHLLAFSGVYKTFTLAADADAYSYYLRRYDGLRSLPPSMLYFYPKPELERIEASSTGYELDVDFLREIAQQPARLVAAGGHIGMGSHGNIPGIGYHFEMWTHALGGMKNHDILRAATLWSAEAIGHDKDLGSIEPGKLADLVVLDANPLEDIHNTLKLNSIMKNGRLYTPFTLKDSMLTEHRLSTGLETGN